MPGGEAGVARRGRRADEPLRLSRMLLRKKIVFWQVGSLACVQIEVDNSCLRFQVASTVVVVHDHCPQVRADMVTGVSGVLTPPGSLLAQYIP